MDPQYFIDVFLRRPWLHGSTYFFVFVVVLFLKRLNFIGRQLSFIVIIYAIHNLLCSHLAFSKIETSWTFNLICMPLTWMIVKLLTDNLSNKRHIKLIRNTTIICIFIHVLNISYFQGIRYIATYTYLILQAMNAVVAFYYLKDQMDSTDGHPSLNVLNWFAAATLIDHITSIPITATLSQDMIGFTNAKYVTFLIKIMTFVYGCWYLIISAGIIWNKTALSSRFLSRSSP